MDDLDEDEADAPSIAAAIEAGEVRAVFQPVVDLVSEEAIGWEAYGRLDDSALGFDRLRRQAETEDLGAELEYSILRAIIEHGAPPGDRLLFVNVSAAMLRDDRLLDEVGSLGSRVAIDVRGTEIDELLGIETQLDALALAGVHLSLDDTTAASLGMIARLRPSFVKIDRSVTEQVSHDPTARSVMHAYLAFAESEGMYVIAEGLERLDQLEVLNDIGVPFAQGYLFGMPTPDWTPPSRRRLRPPDPFEPSLELDGRFDAATDLHAIAEMACSELRARGLYPAVYIEREGVLRCVAQQGYAQVLDGVPVRSGLMASAFRSGRTQVVEPETAEDFIHTAPGIATAVAVPLRVGPRVVGVLDVESRSAIEPDVVAEIELLALAMQERLEVVGVRLDQSALHHMVRASNELSALGDIPQIESACTRLACEISGLSSAMLAVLDDDGGYQVRALQGPLSAQLRGIPEPVIEQLARYLEHVSSCLASGEEGDLMSPVMAEVRGAGATAVAAFPLRPSETAHGVLLVADHSPVELSIEEREAMEMLAREIGRALDMAVVMADLRDRASRDTLTGLGNVAAFREALSAMGGRRTNRWAVAMGDVDGLKNVNDTHGHLVGDQVLQALAGALQDALRMEDRIYRVGGDEFAAILHDVDEVGAAEIGTRLSEAAATVMGEYGGGMSFGIALPAPEEEPDDFVDRADKMLYEVKSEARGTARIAEPPEE